MNKPRTYQLGIVGEAHYQPAIERCSPGDCVEVMHEPDNPYGKDALAVVTLGGDTIGYVAGDCWLQDAIHEERKGCDAIIRSIRTADKGLLGVVLDVTLNTKGVRQRAFSRASTPKRVAQRKSRATRPAKSWLERLLGI